MIDEARGQEQPLPPQAEPRLPHVPIPPRVNPRCDVHAGPIPDGIPCVEMVRPRGQRRNGDGSVYRICAMCWRFMRTEVKGAVKQRPEMAAIFGEETPEESGPPGLINPHTRRRFRG